MKKRLRLIVTIAVIVALGGGYWGYKKYTAKADVTRYVLASAQKGAVVVSVTGSGQVSSENQIDVKSKASGDVVAVPVKEGQDVTSGQVLLQLDATSAQKAVRDAQVNLDSAKLTLQKMLQPADALSLIQAENALAQAQQSKDKAASDLKKSYDDAFVSISNAFLDLPGAVTGTQDILYKSSYGPSQNNIDYYSDAVINYDARVTTYKTSAANAYQTARAAYDKTFLDYKALSRASDQATIEAVLDETYDTATVVSDSVKSIDNFLSFVKDRLTERNLPVPSQLSAHEASLSTFTGQIDNDLSSLLSSKNEIKTAKDSATNADLNISAQTASLAKLKAGADPLDIQNAQLTIVQRQNALLDAQQNLADYTLRAPFDGTLAKLDFKKADSVSAGAAAATLSARQKLAIVSLNEVDVAKIKMGQKATLTFDAVNGLSIAGEVVEIDTLGTVSQGVVTYNVKIGFDTQDDRVKPGMSVSAAIVTDIHQDVLIVPNAAVKSQNNASYVQELDHAVPADQLSNQGVVSPTPPVQAAVEVGLASDSVTEITSGLKEGDQVIVRTITAAKTTTTTAPSLLPTGGRGGGGGGALRAFRPGGD